MMDTFDGRVSLVGGSATGVAKPPNQLKKEEEGVPGSDPGNRRSLPGVLVLGAAAGGTAMRACQQ